MRAILLLLVLTGCASSSVLNNAGRKPSSVGDCDGIRSLDDNAFTWPEFAAALSAQKSLLTSTDKVLCLLSTGAQKSSVIMTNSRSLQRSSASTPRVIVFGTELPQPNRESLYASFNADGPLEILRYNPSQPARKQIEMIEVTAGPMGPVVHAGTPAKCQKCHGIEPRFMWSERDFWPAALQGGSVFRTDAELAQFQKTLESSGRYQMAKFRGSSAVNNSLSSMNHNASLINTYRLHEKVRTSPEYEFYKFAILGAVAGCPLDEFIPDHIRAHQQNLSFVRNPNGAAAVKALKEDFTALIRSTGAAPSDVEALMRSRGRLLRGEADPVYLAYLADQYAIIKDKVKFGMKPEDNFPFSAFFDPYSANLRYLFESRGIGIEDWSYDDIQGMYHFSLETLVAGHKTLGEHPALVDFLIQSDRELRFPESEVLYQAANDERFQILSAIPGDKRGADLCQALKNKSLTRLAALQTPQTFPLSKHSAAADANWRNHFSATAKIKSLPVDLPTGPASSRSCTQCHFGYSANYSGPKFERESKAYPLALMTCANCHADSSARMAPLIPFNNERELQRYMESDPSLPYAIAHRLSDKAKGELTHMPPVLLLNPRAKASILKYFGVTAD